ncbi:hypothetical protein HAX54_042698 [Datura stramonium]|uniref:Nop domain-containing protein n=1 Tax=Datura stramonium TaxID=4076 RepID=A0ABS8VZS8_DATST|nr:hypothetical protein [Datura stramonium]
MTRLGDYDRMDRQDNGDSCGFFVADLEELSDYVVDLEIAEQIEEDGKVDDDDIDNVSKLQKSPNYIDIMQKIDDANVRSKGKTVLLEVDDDPEHHLIVACIALSVDTENEIVIIHNFIRDKYGLRFPELVSIVPQPIDYARVVRKIGCQLDLTLVDLEGLLPSANNQDCLCRGINYQKKILQFAENHTWYIAPNLSVVVGNVVAAKLMGAAGGLWSLAKMPLCDVEVLGAKRKNLRGFPSHIYDVRPVGAGYINQSEIFKSAPPSFRIQTYQLVARKCIFAARMDSIRGDPTGEYGRSLIEEILKRIERWQNPPPIPIPTDSEHCKRKRGGRVPQRKRKKHLVLNPSES